MSVSDNDNDVDMITGDLGATDDIVSTDTSTNVDDATSYFISMPLEVITHICKYLPLCVLIRVAMVCTRLRVVCRDHVPVDVISTDTWPLTDDRLRVLSGLFHAASRLVIKEGKSGVIKYDTVANFVSVNPNITGIDIIHMNGSLYHRSDLDWLKLLRKISSESANGDRRHITELSVIGGQNIQETIVAGFPVLRHLTLTTYESDLSVRIGGLRALRSLNLRNCEKIKTIPETISNISTLETLNIHGCRSVTTISETISNLKALKTLSFKSCSSLVGLPESIGSLDALTTLDLSTCTMLMSLPNSIGSLNQLETLTLSGCNSLTELPESIGFL
jgi:Leucine-rich repeat (LRR) protein